MSDINNCLNNKTCYASTVQSCINPDQISAQKVQHTCTGQNIVGQSSGNCLQQNGEKVPEGTIEKYYTKCGAVDQCAGALSLVGFNFNKGSGFNIFSGSVCMKTPLYTKNSEDNYTNLSPIKQSSCSLTDIYNGIPSQLFNLERAKFSGGKFTSSFNGEYYRIIHRPTGYYVSPELVSTTSRKTYVEANLELKKINSTNDGYFWYYLEEIKHPDPRFSNLTSIPQFIYIDDMTRFKTKIDLYSYLTDNVNPVYGMQPELIVENKILKPLNNGNLKMKTFQAYNKLDLDENFLKINTCKYIKYSTISFTIQTGV